MTFMTILQRYFDNARRQCAAGGRKEQIFARGMVMRTEAYCQGTLFLEHYVPRVSRPPLYLSPFQGERTASQIAAFLVARGASPPEQAAFSSRSE
jgi:hypothetical protein